MRAAIIAALVAALSFPVMAYEQGDEVGAAVFCRTKEAIERHALAGTPEKAVTVWNHYVQTGECIELSEPWPFLIIEVGNTYSVFDGLYLTVIAIAPFRMDTGGYSTELFYALFQEPTRGS